MDIVIGKGGRLSKLEMNLTNQNLTLNTWYRMEGTETAFIAAVPRSAQNRIKYTYALRETLAPSRTYKLQLVANNIQLGITMIGLFIFFVSLLSIYLHRRYKHYKKIRDRDSQDEDEDSVNITPQKKPDFSKSMKKMSMAVGQLDKSQDQDMSGSKLFGKLTNK